MNKFVAAACAAFVSVGAVFAQAAPSRVLDQKSLDRFLSDFVNISKDTEAAGISMEGAGGSSEDPDDASGSMSQMIRDGLDAMKKNPEARKLLAKYGWDEKFWDIYFALGISYGIISMEESFQGQPLPEEAKPIVDDMRTMVHANDLDLVKKNFDKIGAVFESSN